MQLPTDVRVEGRLQPTGNEEYEYHVDVIAGEAFRNLMSKFGVAIGYDKGQLDFSLNNRLDMKSLKKKGLIRSYTIIRKLKTDEVVEEG